MVIFEESTKINGDITMENYGKSKFLMGKLTISMAIFNSYVGLPEGSRGEMIRTPRPRSTIPRPPAKSKPPLPVAMMFPGQAHAAPMPWLFQYDHVMTHYDHYEVALFFHNSGYLDAPWWVSHVRTFGTPFFGKLNIQNCAMLQGSQYKGMLQSCLEIPAVEKMTRPQTDARWSKFTSEEQFL